ncbi:SsrA-binding protein SmpB [Hwanghaeella grinnelliae]|uniref:SsrA-binding protein n=1 Tax=Hwanghaeella grinnelliae TaxID=2500179 RepID=A0A437QK05_9PROT|nr:SsrA-binding protein SmpB [Hwanghaeella grinnelliae]RVU34844.1 SsrA-binding protein SmpB [Hwanghaeella grinnelliae]
MAGKNKGKGRALSSGTVAMNRRARFDYEILETIEAGLVLTGTEVKALRISGASLNEAYAGIKDGELYLFNVHIPEYPNAPVAFQHEPKRLRKLLVHKKQRDKLIGAIKRDGMTLVPVSLFFNHRGLCKLSLGLAKGKKAHDKRETIKERDWNRRKGQLLREAG